MGEYPNDERRNPQHRVKTAPRRGCDESRATQLPHLRSPAAPDRFRAAVQDAKIGADKDIPHVTAEIIVKYITDLRLLGPL
ncbi:MAG: hypothetical protein K2X52_01500 [Mycobacteriaceae bacterium]|nr:hypothetical protein [Mycobacteriaceae bacterium]